MLIKQLLKGLFRISSLNIDFSMALKFLYLYDVSTSLYIIKHMYY